MGTESTRNTKSRARDRHTTEHESSEGGARPARVVKLTASEALALAREGVVGRLAVTIEGQPEIFPVNYVIDHGSVVFRTARGTKLAGCDGRLVAFEIDEYDEATGKAWSVVIKGTAREINRLQEVVDALELPLDAWYAAPDALWIRVDRAAVSGRRFARHPGHAEHPSVHHASPE